MLDVTIDSDGKFRIHPESTASLRVIHEASGSITVTNLGGFPVILNGDGVARYGQDRFYLAAGKSQRFPQREVVMA